MEDAIRESGMLPFFRNRVPGWSVEERIDPGIWFTDREGPWEWKGPLASSGVCVYGKFLRGKAAKGFRVVWILDRIRESIVHQHRVQLSLLGL